MNDSSWRTTWAGYKGWGGPWQQPGKFGGGGSAFPIRRVTLMCRLSDTHLTKIQSVNDCDVDADKNQSTKCPENVEELA